ncbi:hypothetical protein [Zhihengliuella halotolerans]|uniref:hypothetical protein n=1 Tax=Zhihengliuella halotolerans TaxID=370736 RepID=UPI000C80EEF9|nr:hypothetical protein [Zhihengliuella halotolerans]
MTKPADMTRHELLAEVDRLATLNNELSQILNRNADTLQASAQQIQRDAVRQTAAIVREGGGVMPEELPEVRTALDQRLGGVVYISGETRRLQFGEDRALQAKMTRKAGVELLAIAQKIEEAGA